MNIKIKTIKYLKLEIIKTKESIVNTEWKLRQYKKHANCLIYPKKVIKNIQNKLYRRRAKLNDLQFNLLKVINKPFSGCHICEKQFGISTVAYCEDCLNKKLKLGNKYYCIVDEIKDKLEEYKNHSEGIKVAYIANNLLKYILEAENKK